MMETRQRKGEIAKLAVIRTAFEKDLIPSIPASDCGRYDLIIDDNGKLERIQIKHGGYKQKNKSQSSIVVDLRKPGKGGKLRSYTSAEIDYIMIYISDLDVICKFGPEVFENKKALSIRVADAKNGQTKNTIYFADYIW